MVEKLPPASRHGAPEHLISLSVFFRARSFSAHRGLTTLWQSHSWGLHMIGVVVVRRGM